MARVAGSVGSEMRRVRASLAIVGVTALLAVALDVRAPGRIAWEHAELQGISTWRAPGLVLQEQRGDVLWAARGYSVYRSRGGEAFERVHTVRPPSGEAWGGFSRALRDRFHYQELAEVVALRDDLVLVFAGGRIHRVDLATGEDVMVHHLRYFGRDQGRGVMPHGITLDDAGSIYYGEYPTRRMGPGDTVRIYRSDDEGRTWQVAYEFPAFSTRHIHAVRWDPYGRKLWVGTGDRDHESRVGYSTDRGRSFSWVGGGSQVFRTCSFVFTPESVTWGMDSPAVASRLVRWRRADGNLELSSAAFPSAAYYAQGLVGDRALLTVGETHVGVWLAGSEGDPMPLLEWDVDPDPSKPHAVVRLARGPIDESDWFYVNPLRTLSDRDAIYRLPRHVATAPALRLAAAHAGEGESPLP
jgi:hypothetical protein